LISHIETRITLLLSTQL